MAARSRSLRSRGNPLAGGLQPIRSLATWKPLPRLWLAACVLAPLIAVAPSKVAQAADAPSGPSVRIAAFSPAVLVRERGLRIGGSFGGSDDVSATIRITVSRTPLSSRSSLTDVTTSRAAAAEVARQGRLLGAVKMPTGSKKWQVVIDPTALDLRSMRPGVYAIAAGVWRGDALLAATATAAPYASSSTAFKPSRIVMLWPVTSMPMRDFNNGVSNTRLTTTLSKTGVLHALLSANDTPGLSWLVDPALVLTLRTAANPPPKVSARATSSTRAAAAQWLRDLRGAADTNRITALPASLPDIAALDKTNFNSDYIRAQRDARSRVRYAVKPRFQVLQTAAWPCIRGVSCISEKLLSSLGDNKGARASVVVLPDSAATVSNRSFSGGGVQRLPGHANVPLLYTDKNLDEAIAGTTGIATAAALRQRILSDLALISFERPGRPRTVVATAPIGIESSHAARGVTAAAAAMNLAAEAGLIAPVTLNKIAGLDNDGISRHLRDSSVPLAAKQGIRNAASARQDALRAALLPAARSDRLAWRRNADDMFLAASSIIWRTHKQAHSEFTSQMRADASAMRTGVEVLAADRVWLGSRRGTIPFTLHNTLSVPVTVYPRLRAEPLTRIVFTNPATSVTLQPGERAGMPVDVTLLGGTAVRVSVEVRDAKERVINVPKATQVGTSAYARFSLYIVVVAGIALLLLMLNNIRRTIRRRRAGSTEDDPNAVVEPQATDADESTHPDDDEEPRT